MISLLQLKLLNGWHCCKVEELRNPTLRDRPLGITQKYLVVTCNYHARDRGVTKLMRTSDARKRCPEIVLVSGEDLTPYRELAKQIITVAKRFGVVEKLGMDEVFVDATEVIASPVQPILLQHVLTTAKFKCVKFFFMPHYRKRREDPKILPLKGCGRDISIHPATVSTRKADIDQWISEFTTFLAQVNRHRLHHLQWR